MFSRRRILTAGSLATAALVLSPRSFCEAPSRFRDLPAALAGLEKAHGARLGVAVVDTGTGEMAGLRMQERFAMCSTFKMLLSAAVLQRADRGLEKMDRAVKIPPKPLVEYSPLTEEHAGQTMTVAELCHAAMTRSDNTAANLLLETIGGPSGITRFARSIGDSVTRLDRTETTLNEATPGDPRDTTSPAAMAANLKTLLLGKVLSEAARAQLTGWMVENTYGNTRLRAEVPAGWRAADKTGANGSTTTNDIAVFWPAKGAPVLVAAYLTECVGTEAVRNEVLAEVGRLVVKALQAK